MVNCVGSNESKGFVESLCTNSFKLRCRITDPNNYKGIYEFLECSACGVEEEDQKHILECAVLLSLNKETLETPKYKNGPNFGSL